MVMSIFRLLGV
jgi:hypothetical protein